MLELFGTVLLLAAMFAAIVVLARSITATLVQYETVKKWNGQLPTVSGGSTPLIQLPSSK